MSYKISWRPELQWIRVIQCSSTTVAETPRPLQANASNALRRRAGLNAGASCARCLRAAEVLLLPLLRCKPYLTSVPTDCGSSSPCEASLELPTCRPRRSRLSPSSSLQVRRAADCCCCACGCRCLRLADAHSSNLCCRHPPDTALCFSVASPRRWIGGLLEFCCA